MGIMWQDVGCDNCLKAWLNNTRPVGGNNLTLKLFVNNITPVRGDAAATYTEATGGGYAAKTLAAGSWTVSGTGTPRAATYAQQTWTFTGALTTNPTIYGYYIVDADGIIVWSEKLGASFTPTTNGDTESVTPQFQLSNGTPA